MASSPERGRALILPGNDLSAPFYRSLLETLAAEGIRATALSFAAFVGQGGPTTWEALVEETLAAAEEHLSPGGLLIGHSLGGLVALLTASRAPAAVQRLALLEPAIAPLAFLARAAGHRYQRDVVHGQRDQFDNWTGAFRRLHAPETFPQASLELYLRARREGDPSVVAGLLESMSALYPLGLGALKLPTLLLRGASSGWRAALGARGLAYRIPNARLEVIPEAGHWLVGEQDAAIARTLARFNEPEADRGAPAGQP